MDTAQTRVLLVEDSRMDSRLISLYLGESAAMHFAITAVERLREALQRLREQKFDVILCDLSLPDSQGLETFERLHTQAPAVPILVLSGADDDTLALTAVREGAQDYLVKGRFDPYLLSRAITYAIERQRVELALQEREQRYRHLLESITDYLYTVELENGRPARSVHGPGCEAVTGYTPMEYQADRNLWYRMVHEEDRPGVLNQATAVVKGGTPPPVEHRIIHKDGQVRWVRSSVVPRRDEQGQLVAYDGLVSDITERKKAEGKVVAEQAFYLSLVENLPQNIFRKDLSERFTFANQNFCKMLGRPLEEIIGKNDFDFYPPELATKYQHDDREVIRTGRSFETIEENVSPKGDKIYVHVVKVPIFGPRTQVLGTQCIFWDITERKRFEEQLQKANAELARSEAALRKSHEDLKAAQLQLIQAEKMESIGTLAAGVAHEVKNPLAILQMGVGYLGKKIQPGDENMALVLKEMKEAIERADTITRGLLDFSAARQLALNPEDVNELIEEAFPLVRHQFLEKEIKLVKALGRRLPKVAADKNRIQQVIVNVLLNSVHAMSPGGTVTVRTLAKQMTETSFSEGSRRASSFWVGDTAVVVEVDDTGPGIPIEHLTKIFDPFFTTKPVGEGTGLGLPVSRRIIELHGGTIDVTNIPGSGVRVTLKLRVHKDQNDRDKKAHPAG